MGEWAGRSYLQDSAVWVLDLDGRDGAALARRWADAHLAGLPGEGRGAFSGRVAPHWIRDDEPHEVIGDPLAWYGVIECDRVGHRERRRILSTQAWDAGWAELSHEGVDVWVSLGRLDEQGRDSRHTAVTIQASISSMADEGWLELTAGINVRWGLEPLVGEDWLVDSLSRFVREEEVTFAMMSPCGLFSSIERGQVSPPQAIIPASDRVLRGYEWLMVLPRPIVESLGGLQELIDTGVFWRVEPVVGGGVLVQATEHFADYDRQHLEKVFEVFKPVLPRRKLIAPPFDLSPWVLYDREGDADDPVGLFSRRSRTP